MNETLNETNNNNNNINNNNNNIYAPSYRSRTPQDVLRTAESVKKRKYLQACLDRRASFTPLCMSVDGLLGKEAEFFLYRLDDFLAAH